MKNDSSILHLCNQALSSNVGSVVSTEEGRAVNKDSKVIHACNVDPATLVDKNPQAAVRQKFSACNTIQNSSFQSDGAIPSKAPIIVTNNSFSSSGSSHVVTPR